MLGTDDVHWSGLRFSLAAFTAATLTGVAAAATAWWHEQRVVEEMEAAEVRLDEGRGRYLALAEERETWNRFGPLYRRLAARGRLGEEQPERWIEAVRSALEEVPAARYRLGSTHAAENAGPVEVRVTDMSIELEIRHEAELPRILGALERDAPGTFTVSRCRLERTVGSETREPRSANVGAACRLQWQSVVLSGAGPGWTPAVGREGGSGAGATAALPDEGLDEPPPDTLGRLFTTAAERARIDEALASRNAAPVAGETPVEFPPRAVPPPRQARWMHVGGVIHRSGRSVAAWVDGTRIAHDEPHPERPSLAGPRPSSGVRLDAEGRSIVVRPGQRFDPHTGAVIDPVRSPGNRFRRGRSRHESSSAPLTVPPAPSQN